MHVSYASIVLTIAGGKVLQDAPLGAVLYLFN